MAQDTFRPDKAAGGAAAACCDWQQRSLGGFIRAGCNGYLCTLIKKAARAQI